MFQQFYKIDEKQNSNTDFQQQLSNKRSTEHTENKKEPIIKDNMKLKNKKIPKKIILKGIRRKKNKIKKRPIINYDKKTKNKSKHVN